jgi:ribosomal protein L39E
MAPPFFCAVSLRGAEYFVRACRPLPTLPSTAASSSPPSRARPLLLSPPPPPRRRSHKTLRVKKLLAVNARRNRPLPQWTRMKTGDQPRCVTSPGPPLGAPCWSVVGCGAGPAPARPTRHLAPLRPFCLPPLLCAATTTSARTGGRPSWAFERVSLACAACFVDAALSLPGCCCPCRFPIALRAATPTLHLSLAAGLPACYLLRSTAVACACSRRLWRARARSRHSRERAARTLSPYYCLRGSVCPVLKERVKERAKVGNRLRRSGSGVGGRR